jgi:hypothetical protein
MCSRDTAGFCRVSERLSYYAPYLTRRRNRPVWESRGG